MLATVDYALHKVFVDLKMNGMYDNCVVLVTTDNGGEPWNSNFPLKGTKETLYEGGIRGASFLSSPLLNMTGYKYTGLMHITDWVPTLLGLAGVPKLEGIDGQDMWDALSNNLTSPRMGIIHNIDEDNDKGTWQAAVTSGKWKMIWGQEYLLKKPQPFQSKKVQLYDIIDDPNEVKDVSSENPELVKLLEEEILTAKEESYIPADWPPGTKKGWPNRFGGFISSGWCEVK